MMNNVLSLARIGGPGEFWFKCRPKDPHSYDAPDSEGRRMECYHGCRLILELMGDDLLLDIKTLNILV